MISSLYDLMNPMNHYICSIGKKCSFGKKVLTQVAKEYKLKPADVRDLTTNYMAIPRGIVQKDIDYDTLKETGKYIIVHGGDVPVSQIKHFVLQDFGLIPLSIHNKVQWVVNNHEKTDPKDKKALKDAIKLSKKK